MSWRANLGVIVICLLLFAVVSRRWSEDLRGVTGNVLAGALIAIVEASIVNWSVLIFWIHAQALGTELVRVSVSYLVRVRINGRYLLVRGHRITTQYQPVGGAYKYYSSALATLQTLRALDDDKVPLDDTSKHDLRLRIPARKLPEFRRWFESEKGREIGPWREFYEELIDTGLLPQSVFPHARCEFVGRHYSGIHFSKYFNCREMLVADIFELCPTTAQEEVLMKTLQRSSEEFTWATEGEIRSLGVVPPSKLRADISPTASWII